MFKRLLASIAIVSVVAAPALADNLGPSTTNNIGSDPSTLNALQPATPSGLQSADSQNGGVKQSGSATSLQPAGTKSDFPANLDLGGVADGGPHSPSSNSSTSHINQYVLAMIGALMLICAFFTYRISKLLETRKVLYFPNEAPLANPAADSAEIPSGDTTGMSGPDEQPEPIKETTSPEESDPIENVSIDTTREPTPQPKSKRSTKKKTNKPSRRKK